jgi:hypothetical protein
MPSVGGTIVRFIGRSASDVSPKRVGGTSLVVAGVEQLHPKQTLTLAPQATAATTKTTVIGEAPYAGVVSSVTFIANATITGVDTDNRKFAVVNKGQSGAGSTEVAGLTFANTVNAAAGDSRAITLSGTPANLVVAQGDVLALVETVNGNGLTHGGGLVTVVYDAA